MKTQKCEDCHTPFQPEEDETRCPACAVEAEQYSWRKPTRSRRYEGFEPSNE